MVQDRSGRGATTSRELGSTVARPGDRLGDNAPGELYVDSSCIDCDQCRQLAPHTFGRHDVVGQSVVRQQPRGAAELHRALMALVTCPTHSIGTVNKIDSRAAARAFPESLAPGIDDVMRTGWASPDSYGAAAWLIRRPQGNVLVDSPRTSRILMDQVAALGGVRWMFLTHRDDVADHQAWHARFGCERILHCQDLGPSTRAVERIIDGEDAITLTEDLQIIPVPGHTAGSCALRFRETFLFSGDHVWAKDGEDGLEAGRDVCWHSWAAQHRSMLRLAEHRFTWVLPGHGRPWQAPDAAAMHAELRRLAAVM